MARDLLSTEAGLSRKSIHHRTLCSPDVDTRRLCTQGNDQRTSRRAPARARLWVRQSFVEARQAIIVDVLPRRRVSDELVSRRPHAGVSVDRCHANYRDLSGLGIASKEV